MQFLLPRPLLILPACTPAPSAKTDGGSDAAESITCENDDGCKAGYICEQEACTAGDRDNDAATATAIFWETEIGGLINPAGDTDWFAITAEGGEFARVQVNTFEDDNDLNSVVSIFDSAGHRVAWEDEHPAGSVSVDDSVCFAYLAEAGTYYVKVEDYSTFYGESPVGGFGSDYLLTVKEASAGAEPDSPQSTGSDIEPASGYIYPFLWVLGEAGDIDYQRIDLAYTDTWLSVVGATHVDGSTAEPVYTLRNTDGETILEKAAPTSEDAAWLVGAAGTRYVLGAEDARAAGDANTWGVAFVQVQEEGFGARSREVEPNDDVDVATALPLDAVDVDSGEAWSRGTQGTLGIDDLADVYEITVTTADAYITVDMWASAYGSMLAATVAVLDASGSVLAEDAFDGEDPHVVNLPADPGDYFVRISGASTSAVAEGGYYAAAVYVTNYELARD